MKRFAPAVDWPYGIPLKLNTPSPRDPRTLPDLVSTTGESSTTADTASLVDIGRMPVAAAPAAHCSSGRRFDFIAVSFDIMLRFLVWQLALYSTIAPDCLTSLPHLSCSDRI